MNVRSPLRRHFPPLAGLKPNNFTSLPISHPEQPEVVYHAVRPLFRLLPPSTPSLLFQGLRLDPFG